MKKIATLLLAALALGSLFADLQVNIPFDTNIVSQSFAEAGVFDYESEWMEITNTGTETQNYTLYWSPNNAPEGWSMSVCNPISCYMPNFAVPIPLTAGETLQIHIQISVDSAGGYPFDITIDGGDLSAPEVLSFTFNTADNVTESGLEVTIPFSTDIIGQSFDEVGEYEYESEWMEITNTGSETQDYTLFWSPNTAPEGWSMSVCNPASCYMPNFAVPIPLDAGETLQIHIQITVHSADNFPFDITIAGGDLTEPEVLSFTFTSETNSSADDAVAVAPVLSQNYPNPFNPTTTINYSLAANTNGSMKIFNIKGEVVKIFENLSGDNNVTWNGNDNRGKSVSSGIYYYRLNGGTKTVTKKMILMK